jgi:hypothetical protein
LPVPTLAPAASVPREDKKPPPPITAKVLPPVATSRTDAPLILTNVPSPAVDFDAMKKSILDSVKAKLDAFAAELLDSMGAELEAHRPGATRA